MVYVFSSFLVISTPSILKIFSVAKQSSDSKRPVILPMPSDIDNKISDL